jgi:serine/threonine-protein kinase
VIQPGIVDPERWRRVEAVLDQVLELPAAERTTRVEVLCAGRPDLRDEVLGLLSADARADGFLAEPAARRAAGLLDDAAGEEPEEPPYAGRLGPYELVRVLGRGGMGVVWEGRDVRLGRRVAVKLLPDGWMRGTAAADRLLREARAASALEHPNVCTLFDVGTAPDGRLYLVLAFYPGETLAERLERGPLPLATALDLALQVGRGLAAAHAAGIVHRDVKPSNVLVTEGGVAKVLDFGISKIAGDGTLTAQGALIGTPAYMAPEQIAGGRVDGRTDLWSLAVVLYEMVAGRRPFAGESTEALLYAVVHRRPEPLPRLAPQVQRRLDRAIRQALAKSPDARPAGVEPFLDELAAVRAALDGPPRRHPGWRRAAWVALAASAVAGAAVAPPVRRALDRRTEPAAPAAGSPVAPADEAAELLRHGYRLGNPERAAALYQRMLAGGGCHAAAYARLAEAQLWMFTAGRDPSLPERARANAELAVGCDPRLARAQRALGVALSTVGELDGALARLDEAVALDPLSAAAHRERGVVLARLGRTDEAEDELARAAELDPDDWLTHERLALDAYARGDDAAAEAAYRRALELAPDHSGLYDRLAAVLYRRGRLEEAAAALQHSLEIDPRDRTYTNLGTLLFSLGRYRAALGSFERAIELGANHYLNWANLGDGYRWTGQPERAAEAFARALQLLAPELAKAPGDSTLQSRRALYLAKRGDTAEALAELAALGPLPATDPSLAYRALVVYELAGSRDRALGALATALGAGHPLAEIRTDPELFELRRDPRYHRTVLPFDAAPPPP